MKKTPTAPARCFVFAIASLALGLALTVSAATPVSWAVNGGGSWNAPGNWDPATVPNGAGEFAVLTNNVVATAIVTNDVNVTLGTLWIGPLDNVANYTITNNPGIGLTFDNSGSGAQIIQLTGSASSDRVYPPIALADNLTITNDTSKVLQLYG